VYKPIRTICTDRDFANIPVNTVNVTMSMFLIMNHLPEKFRISDMDQNGYYQLINEENGDVVYYEIYYTLYWL